MDSLWLYITIGIAGVLVLALCFCLAVANFSVENYFDKLKKISVPNKNGVSAYNFASHINTNYFDSKLVMARCEENNDHYSKGCVALSDKTKYSNTVASLAIVAHELGHARQDVEGDALDRHWNLRHTGRIFGLLFMPLMLAGIALSFLYVFSVLPSWSLYTGLGLVGLGIIIFLFAIFVKYREIQIEKQASKYAMEFLQLALTDDEMAKAKDFLNSARLTYWASLLRTMFSWTLLTGKDKMFH